MLFFKTILCYRIFCVFDILVFYICVFSPGSTTSSVRDPPSTTSITDNKRDVAILSSPRHCISLKPQSCRAANASEGGQGEAMRGEASRREAKARSREAKATRRESTRRESKGGQCTQMWKEQCVLRLCARVAPTVVMRMHVCVRAYVYIFL